MVGDIGEPSQSPHWHGWLEARPQEIAETRVRRVGAIEARGRSTKKCVMLDDLVCLEDGR